MEYCDEVPVSLLFPEVVGSGQKVGCSSVGLETGCFTQRLLLLSIDSLFGKERVTIAFRILKCLSILEMKLNGTVLCIGF